MKKLVLNLALLLLASALFAQITVTNATFPVAGDTLKLVVNANPGTLAITGNGGPYTWDYSNLSATSLQKIVYRPASQGTVGAQLPNAELVADVSGAEAYYNVTANSFEWLAAYGADPIGLGLQMLFNFSPPIPERHAPLNFIDNFTVNSSLSLPFSSDLIPQQIQDSIPIPLPDSLRIRVVLQRNDLVDAHGTISIPGGTYEVLREKRTEYRDTRIDVLAPFIGWVDVTDQIISGTGALDNLGKDTTVTYNFFAADVKEPIAIITTDASGQNATQVVFKDNDILNGSHEILAKAGTVTVSPNPASDAANFIFENWETGSYDLSIFNSTGSLVLEKKLSLNGSQSEHVPFGQFGPGTYFYQIKKTGSRLGATGRFIKL